MKRRRFLACLGAGAAGLMFPRLSAEAGSGRNAGPGAGPNFVLIMDEAHGWSSNSVQMDDTRPESKSRSAQTPNLARLAEQGVRFSQAYASSPRCTPSRAALFTGKTPAQLHMTFVNDETRGMAATRALVPPNCLLELPEAETTVAEVLKRAGYATAHFGKWHVGRANPSRHGFDESDGATSNRGPGGTDLPNPQEAFGITQRGIAFAKRQVQAGKPFYVQLSHYNARNPQDVTPAAVSAFMNRTGLKDTRTAAAFAGVEEMDATIGSVLAALDELGIADNTYVIYTSDHGSQGRNENAPLLGGKGTLWEGGIRVPLIVRGPGIKAGAVSHVAAVGHDLFPTIAELARVSEAFPVGVEGGSLAPVLKSGGTGVVKRSREELVFHFPHYDHDASGPGSALLLGNYKLIRFYETGALHLFDLSKDIGEQQNLAATMPDKAKDLERRLDAYLAAIGAQMPTRNAGFVPGTSSETARPDRRQKPGRDPQRQRGGGQKRQWLQ